MELASPHVFDQGVAQWKAYLESPLGRIRQELIQCALTRHLPPELRIKKILDAGCGLGDGVRPWMGKGCQIFLCDFSSAMLAAARENLLAAGPGDGELVFIETSASDLPARFEAGFFDLVLCHTLLDFVESPEAMIAGLSRVLRPGGIFSCVVANRFSESFRRAFRDQDPAGAASAIDEEVFSAGLFQDIRRRAFSFEGLREILLRFGLTPVKEFGIRVFADFFLNERFREEDFYGKVLELERKGMDRDPYRQVGRYIHMIARK